MSVWEPLELDGRKRHARFDTYGPLPGEEICLECPLPGCVGEKARGCPLPASRDAWRETLRGWVEAAAEGDREFEFDLANSRWRQSVMCMMRRLVPEGLRARSTLGRRGGTYVLRVRLVERKRRGR